MWWHCHSTSTNLINSPRESKGQQGMHDFLSWTVTPEPVGKVPIKLEKQIVYFLKTYLCALYDVSQYIRLLSDWYIKNKRLLNVWTERDIWTITDTFALQIWFYVSLFPAYLHIFPRLLFQSSFFGSVFPPLTYFVLFFNLYIVSLLHQIF